MSAWRSYNFTKTKGRDYVRGGGTSTEIYSVHLKNECGDASINDSIVLVESAVKFFHSIQLMPLDDSRIDDGLANDTPCRGLCIKFKKCVTLWNKIGKGIW